MATALKTKVNQQDLKIYPSERLTQTDDGGGMPLGTPLTGALNELFQPISSIARVNGAFYAVLEYMGVLRADDEPLIGAFAAITKPPSDPTVSYLMFEATRFGESRAEILKRIEAYNIATIESNMTLMSTQAKDSRVVQVYISEDESLPFVGDVYCLRQDKAGYAQVEQYVQITRIVKSEVRTFTTGSKTFKKQVVQLEISAKLIADFVGVDYPVESYANAPCKVRETAVADAAQYYGVKPLAAAIAKDAMQCKVTSLMEKLVPTNQISTPLIDLTAAGQTQTLFDGTASDGNVSLSINRNHSAGTISTIYFGNAVTPGTLKISGTGNGITDKGGALIYNTAQIGTIDYASGFATINEPTFGGNLSTATFHAASAELKVANTASTPVDINSQSSSYTLNINPAPAVGTLQVSYRSLGKWYTLKDDGSGVLRGASSQHGSGNVNFTTGTAQISISNLPDIGSSILWSWGTRATYFNRANTAATAKLILQLANDTAPSSIALAWNDGTAKTAQGTVGGAITGNWTGKYDPNTKRILIDTGSNFNHPAGVLDVTVTYAKGDKTNVTIDSPLVEADGKVTIDLGDAPLMAGTVNLRYAVNYVANSNNKSAVISVSDDANGNIIDKDNKVIGTVNYTTAEVKFNPTVKVSAYEMIYSYNMWGVALLPYSAKVTKDATLNGGIAASFFTATPSNQVTENLKSDTIEIDLLPTAQEVIAPGAVNFTWGNKTYFDKGGSLYTDLNTATGSAVTSGVINYQTGIGTLKNWSWKDGQSPFVRSLVTSIDGNPVSQATFRTPAAPIRAGSLQIRATAIDGTKITASSAYSGVITGTLATGVVDFEYGVATVKFGKKVDITDQVKQQPWYDASTDSNGKTWQPLPVFAETITYNADAYTYLPIDSGVVKIDTVRLPQDGRVPIFRRGDSILIRNAQTDNLGSAFTGGQTINLSRNDVDRISLLDADNKPVLGELWDYDLDAGTITFKPSIDLSSYKMPLKAIHAQEQRNRVVDLDIDGTLSLLFAANRNYPIENTYVSSLLIGDDLAVRVSVPFTQRSWNNVWQDTPNGDQLLNKLKLTDYPMILTDDGAITDRWLIKFISNAQFELYSEALGFVGKFDTLTNLAPINPATGKPYFTIDKLAFGTKTPWAAQDVIRFNTWGTLMPVWVLCAVQPNPNPPTGTDGFEQYLFGDTTEVTA